MASYGSVAELKQAFSDLQNSVAGNFGGPPKEITNGELVKVLQVDILIRLADKAAGNNGWNSDYCKNNVSVLPGKDTIEKTEYLVNLLHQEGLNNINTRRDFPLRNPKHVFDDISEKIIEPLMPTINQILP